MFNARPEITKKSLQIKQDDRFFSRLMSKETSLADQSLRVYYGGVPSSVPFEWESQPGTPKKMFYAESTIPPLTPPPSFYSHMLSNNPLNKKRCKYNLIRALLPSRSTGKKDMVPSPTPSPSSSSSSRFSSDRRNDVPMASAADRTQYRQQSRQRSSSSSDSSGDDNKEQIINSPTRTLCFCIGRLKCESTNVLTSSHEW